MVLGRMFGMPSLKQKIAHSHETWDVLGVECKAVFQVLGRLLQLITFKVNHT